MINIVLFLFFLFHHAASNQFNYILNGDFEQPLIYPTNGQTIACPIQWTCNGTQLIGSTYNTTILYGQFVDMEFYGESSLSQIIQLPDAGTCNLDYYQGFYLGWTDYNCTLQIWWNNVLMATKPKATVMGNLQRIVVRGVQGQNVLLLKQVGVFDYGGSVIDNFSLVCIFDSQLKDFGDLEAQYLLPTVFMKSFAFFLSIPTSSIPFCNYFFLILSDLWLYSFDQRNYTGTIKKIFVTINQIQNKKLEALSIWIDFSSLKQKISTSNYLNFTQPKFIENENTSSTLFHSNFQFFIFAIPWTLLISVVLYGLFLLIKQYKISHFIRPYYFTKTTIFQYLLQQQISYFTYVCFSHLRISFTFQFIDKLSLTFTIFFMFIVVIFSLNFYYLIGEYLQKLSSYFHQSVKCGFIGYSLLTWKNLLRSLVRGSVYFFFRFQYNLQMLFLCMVEFLTLMPSLVLNQKYLIYKKKMQYCLDLMYHLLHLSLNITFYLQDACEIYENKQELVAYIYEGQQIVICLLLVSTCISSLFDLMPIKQKTSTKTTSEETKTNSDQYKEQNKSQKQIVQKSEEDETNMVRTWQSESGLKFMTKTSTSKIQSMIKKTVIISAIQIVDIC